MRVPSSWYQRCLRWGQTNITEADPARYDIDLWRRHWRATRVQGVIVNAGGIVAYYPSGLPQHRALRLGGRDLFGEVTAAARGEGLAVIARMDCNRVREPLSRAHPDWVAVDKDGKPFRAGEFYLTCVNSSYYEDFIPSVLHEVAGRYRPDGFGDNSWSGMGRDAICHCANCRRRFHEFCGLSLPRAVGWEDEAYRRWIEWSYARRLEIWDRFNAVTRDAGGPDCLWLGMVHGSLTGCCHGFKDLKAICERTRFLLLDFQSRDPAGLGFPDNADKGLLLNGLLGWDATVIESMAMYQNGVPTFRLSSKPAPEARLWMIEGMAGTIQPWWHHIGAHQEDRRQLNTAAPLMRWHARHSCFLRDRRPVADVGVVWSQRSIDFFGRDVPRERCVLPYQGIVQALMRARIPYVPVHADNLGRDAAGLRVLILPNLGAMTNGQCDAVRGFVNAGGGLLATGDASRCDEWGDPRADFALADLFGAHASGPCPTPELPNPQTWDAWDAHSYLRLDAPDARRPARRHPVVRSFEGTAILPFGGRLTAVSVDKEADVPLTFIPPFPIYPPETAWMRTPATDRPALVTRTLSSGARVAYLPAAIDACFAQGNLPDHGDLLANLVRWLSPRGFSLEVRGAGLLDCRLYRQDRRFILHMVNLTNPGAWRAPVHELVAAGPFRVRLLVGREDTAYGARLLVAGGSVLPRREGRWIAVEVPSILDHEVLVIEPAAAIRTARGRPRAATVGRRRRPG